MNTPIDYSKLAATLDYAALDKKLSQLVERQPPKRRKSAVDVLEPLRERLLNLHRKGWSSGQLASELKAAGVPVSPARIRECLHRWSNGGTSASRRPTRRRQAEPAPHSTTTGVTSAPTTIKKPVIGTDQATLKLR